MVYIWKGTRTTGFPLPLSVIGLLIASYMVLPWFPVTAVAVGVAAWIGFFFWTIRKVKK